MPVLRAFIRETLRWRPPVPTGIPHESTEDDMFDGYRTPKGSPLDQFPAITGYSQFEYGKRTCQGQKLTEADLFVGIGSIAWLFSINIDPRETGPIRSVPPPAYAKGQTARTQSDTQRHDPTMLFSGLLIAKPLPFKFELKIRIQNDVNFDFLGLKTFTLNHYDSPPLLQGCKSFGSSSSAVSAESTATPTDDATSAATTGGATAPATTGDADATPTAEQTTADPTSDGSAMPTTTDDSASTTPLASDTVTTPTTDSTAPTTTNDAASTADVASQGSTDTPTTTIPTPEATSAGKSGSSERRRSTFMRRDNLTVSASSDDEVIANDTEDTFDATDNSDETNDVVSDNSSSADSAEFEADGNEALSLSADQQTEDGITFDTLIHIQKTFQFVPGTDGNLYTVSYTAGSPSDAGLFAESQNVIIGDDEERVLHYYPDKMAAYNVSRIRFNSGSEIPKTADAIALSPIDYDNSDGTPSAYFAVTTKKDVYSLVHCNFANGADSKIFVVNDQSGIDTLQNNANVKFTITGAPVKDCSPLAIVSGGNGTVSAS
ncbi:unnamed protein product [Aureobasidium vineae]|uniref:Uncharacterized protein n=1 Tax=Aureobasidium vineae TaxID=2773715 RepID=A0A9N8K245_9PEZI|nr:unnamed protein product [Aureobasidium vineae]